MNLAGRWVRLEPLAEEHREPLRVAADDDRIWEHMTILARRVRDSVVFFAITKDEWPGVRDRLLERLHVLREKRCSIMAQ